jgi:hypothetical protein
MKGLTVMDRVDYLRRAEVYELLAEETLDGVLATAFRASAKNCRAMAERITELEEGVQR